MLFPFCCLPKKKKGFLTSTSGAASPCFYLQVFVDRVQPLIKLKLLKWNYSVFILCMRGLIKENSINECNLKFGIAFLKFIISFFK